MLPVDSSEFNALRPGGRHDTGCSPCHDRLGRRDDRSLWRRRDRPGSRPMAVSDAVSVIDPVVETMVGHLDAAGYFPLRTSSTYIATRCFLYIKLVVSKQFCIVVKIGLT